jgi:hypothetical protein
MSMLMLILVAAEWLLRRHHDRVSMLPLTLIQSAACKHLEPLSDQQAQLIRHACSASGAPLYSSKAKANIFPP